MILKLKRERTIRILLKKPGRTSPSTTGGRFRQAGAVLIVMLLTCRILPAQTAAKSAVPVAAVSSSSENLTREQALDADLQEAIDMLVKKR